MIVAMDLTIANTTPKIVPTIDADPNQPTLPGLEGDVVARYMKYQDMEKPISIRRDRPVDAPTFASFDDAVRAANELLVQERRDARWGLFNRNPGRVDAIAVLEAAKGVKLVRTDLALDPFKEGVPGQMFPGQNWWQGGARGVVREHPGVLALVGAEHIVDLRSGERLDPVEL